MRFKIVFNNIITNNFIFVYCWNDVIGKIRKLILINLNIITEYKIAITDLQKIITIINILIKI